VSSEVGPADRINGAVDRVKPTPGEPIVDGVGIQPQLEQLLVRHDAVLPPRELPDLR
jgi:hypothetical protein